MSNLRKQARVEQTRSAVERLRNEFAAWHARRVAGDQKKQYQTQLAALETVVCQALSDVEQDAGQVLAAGLGLSDVYGQCRLLENRALWVQRVLWGYYREKFDQRDGPAEARQALEAADDVVWSCYEEARQQAAARAGHFAARRPIPLAYVEPYFSPTALPRDEPPGRLRERGVGQEFLARYFPQLPIPLVGLPPNCLAEPWWLVFLGHEAGHHIQHDLELVLPFSQQLRQIAAAGPRPADAGLWAKWGQEIFADVFSVYMMGAAAVSAMAELEVHPDLEMIDRRDQYPSPAARLALLARVADGLGLKGSEALRGFDPQALLQGPPADALEADLRPALQADLATLDKVAPELDQLVVGGLVTFAQLSGWTAADHGPFGEVYDWQQSLAGAFQKTAPALRSARLIASAAVGRWAEITGSDQIAEQAEALEKLREAMMAAIERSRDQTTRAADNQANVAVDDVARQMSQELRRAEWLAW